MSVNKVAFKDLTEHGNGVFLLRGHLAVMNVGKESQDLGLNASSATSSYLAILKLFLFSFKWG